MHIIVIHLLFLWLIGIIAAVVDTIAGSGGLITLPALLMVGVAPSIALGTNKFQACVGEFNASVYFIKHGNIKIKELLLGALFVIIGSSTGTITVQHLHADLLNKIIPFLLLIVVIYTIFSGKFVNAESRQRLSPTVFYPIFGLLLGFYNGFLGPGTGSFWIVAFMFFLGFDIKKSTMHGKPLNFFGDLISLICFMIAGSINYQIAIIMAIGQLIGSYIGVKLVILQGSKIIRPVFISMVSILAISLFIKFFI
jgi:uncharacterized membrane protein YfcA